MSEKNISESKKSLKEGEEEADTTFDKEIEPDTQTNNDINESNNDTTENNDNDNDNDNDNNILKNEKENADDEGEGKDQKNESGEEEKGSDKVENGDGDGTGTGIEIKNSSGSRRSSIRNSKLNLNNENGITVEKISGSQQKLDEMKEKKNWLPDINKSQNISTYNLDDNSDSYSNSKSKKNKENSDPYSRKAFHMKYQNPFKVSFDITDSNKDKDLFKLRELEIKKKKHEKERQRKLHIYEKNMPKNRNFRELLEDDEDDKLYYQKLKKRNSELILLNQQKRSDRQFGKESLSSFIEKKREMFLLQYSLGVKKDEIKKLEDIIQAEEQKLLEDEKALEEDERKFDAFLRENDDNSVKAIKQAEAETKLKLEKCQEIKKLNQQIMSIRSDMSKNEDLLKDYRRYRQFLESITPESWFEEQEKIYGHSIKYKEKKKTSTESLETPKTNTNTTTTKNSSNNGATSTKRKSTNQNQNYRVKDNKEEEIINEFEEYLNTDDINEPCLLYFTEPKQLLNIFAELEENNLALIQNCQESEESLEILKLQMKESNEKMDKETQQLKQQIEDLNDAISREEEKARQLEEKTIIFNSGGSEGEESQEYLLDELNKKVKDVYKKCIGDNDANLSTLQMLTNVENRLEQLFEMIELMPPDKVEQAEKIKDKERRQRLREEKLGAQISLQEEKVRKSLERARAPIKKKLGKPVAFRSVIPQKVKKQTKETNEIQKDDLDYYW